MVVTQLPIAPLLLLLWREDEALGLAGSEGDGQHAPTADAPCVATLNPTVTVWTISQGEEQARPHKRLARSLELAPR